MIIKCTDSIVMKNPSYERMYQQCYNLQPLINDRLGIVFSPIIDGDITEESIVDNGVTIIIPIGQIGKHQLCGDVVYENYESKTGYTIRLQRSSIDNVYVLYLANNNMSIMANSLSHTLINIIMLDIFRCVLSKEGIKYKLNTSKETITSSIFDTYLKETQSIPDEELIAEMISKVDIDQFRNLIISNLKYQANIPYFKYSKEECVEYLKLWAKAKLPLYVMLGRQLSVSQSHNLEMSEELLRQNIEDLKYLYPKYGVILDDFNSDEFKRNTVKYSDKNIGRYTKIEKGMKLSRLLSNFLEDTKFDTDFSKLIQSSNIDAIFEISINPLDYLTSAFTMSKWDSCHNFIKKERAVGCLSYMLDNSTLVSFIHTGKLYDYSKKFDIKLSWNSKMYRQLIHIDVLNNSMIFNRLYPQSSNNNAVIQYIRNWTEHIVSEFCHISNKWKFSRNSSADKYKFGKYCHAYNDIPNNDHYYVRHASHKKSNINIGVQAKCVKCGSLISQHQKRPCVCWKCVEGYENFRTDIFYQHNVDN